MSTPNKLLWIPIIVELGESTVGRIFDKSPDVKSALMEAKENFDKAEEEARALRSKGHLSD